VSAAASPPPERTPETMSERQRGLGRGLSALLEEAQAEQPVAPPTAPAAGGVRHLPIELIHPNPNQPRKAFDQEELKALSDSIRARGVVQPLIVRPHPRREGEFEIVAGERRWRAAQLAGLHQAPAIVRNLGDREVFELAVIENIQRADLNPIEEATAYSQLMVTTPNPAELANIVGKSRSHVVNTIRLLELPEPVREHLMAGRITAGHARAIATSPKVEALADRIAAEGLSVREAEQLARTEEAGDRPGRAARQRSQPSADSVALEQDLADALGLDVSLKDRGGAGELTVKYKTLEQLDEVCRRLMRADRQQGV